MPQNDITNNYMKQNIDTATTAMTELMIISTSPTIHRSSGSASLAPVMTSLDSPCKKAKLELNSLNSDEISICKRFLLNMKLQQVYKMKEKYVEALTELYFLQCGNNFIDYYGWKKRPSVQLVHFLEQSKIDTTVDVPLDRRKCDTSQSFCSIVGCSELATSVIDANSVTSTTPSKKQDVPSLFELENSNMVTPTIIDESAISCNNILQYPSTCGHLSETGTCTTIKRQLSCQLKHPLPSPSLRLHTSQHCLSSVYDNISGSSQEAIVERAKQEAHVMRRVTELRREGLWSSKRLPRVQDPPRQKAHWDYLLEEMTWLAADFVQERKWKKAASRKIARMVNNHFKELDQKELKAEKEEAVKLKKISSHLARMVRDFWNNIEKIVQYKQQIQIDEKKKRALDLHLDFIVNQTEKYSSWLTEGLQSSGSATCLPTLAHSSDGDVFEPADSISVKEETINKKGTESSGGNEETVANDNEFIATGDVEDMEETIAEQETFEGKNYMEELQDLMDEGKLSIEELAIKYSGAYDSEFEMSNDDTSNDAISTERSDSEVDAMSDDIEIETESSSSSNMELLYTNKDIFEIDKSLGNLLESKDVLSSALSDTQGVEKEEVINDIAAQALSLQPKGYTLETTEVRTQVPFLLKHKLREYQHVGLDWLAIMHDKRLNGILADEMGLGKTIQTIALLAHLACTKSMWGPHLIVVPTSVMLNWEIEIKKWCPAFKILTYYGSMKERKLKRQGWTKTNAFHICITSYKLVVQDHQAFRRKRWKYLILDEAQNIKNFKSQRWQILLNFSSQRRLLLTGTPLQNNLMELWSLMHFLMPNVFQCHRDFKDWFANPLTGIIEGSQEYNEDLIARLHKVLRPFLLRRMKSQVEKQMPKKFEHIVLCSLSKRQRFLYDDFMSQAKTKETLETGQYMSVINILMQLRKVCNHPSLFDPRPVLSPFVMPHLTFTTASIATRALIMHPLQGITISMLFPNLIEMERDLPAFVARRVRQLQTPRCLIQEINSPAKKNLSLPIGHLKHCFLGRMPSVAKPTTSSLPPNPVCVVATGCVACADDVTRGHPSLVKQATHTMINSLHLSSHCSLESATTCHPTASSLPPEPLCVVATGCVVCADDVTRGHPSIVKQATHTMIRSLHLSSHCSLESATTCHPTASSLPPEPVCVVATGCVVCADDVTRGHPSLVKQATHTMIRSLHLSSHCSLESATTCHVNSVASMSKDVSKLHAHPSPGLHLPGFQFTPIFSSECSRITTGGTKVSLQLQQSSATPCSRLSLLSSQPITVQIQQTNRGPRFMIPAGQLSQFPGSLLHIVQTSSGQLMTSSASDFSAVVPTSSSVGTSVCPMTVFASSVAHISQVTCPIFFSTSQKLNAGNFTVLPDTKTCSSQSSGEFSVSTRSDCVHCPPTSTEQAHLLPGKLCVPEAVVTLAGVTPSLVSGIVSTLKAVMSPRVVSNKNFSSLFLPLLHKRRQAWQHKKLERLALVNASRCCMAPVYGANLVQAVMLTSLPGAYVRSGTDCLYHGASSCRGILSPHNASLPHYYWQETSYLADMVVTPVQRLNRLQDVLDRFAFVIPKVISGSVYLHVAHPHPSDITHMCHWSEDLSSKLHCLSEPLNSVNLRMTMAFPELRLIQYDCGKLQTLDILLRQLKNGNHRALIFTQMTKMLNILETFLSYHGYRYVRLDGTTQIEQRQILMDRFNADKRIFCFILSTRSGGIGVNLTGADTVIFYDSDWNPTMDAQAQDRCHRIGQTRDVHIYRLISEMTVEENILKKANQKRLLGDLAIEGGNFTTAFFKEQTIKDLFAEPSGVQTLGGLNVHTSISTAKHPDGCGDNIDESICPIKNSTNETNIVAAFEQALCRAEDESDVRAASQVKAEQNAELAEFDESIPWDEREAQSKAGQEELSKMDLELALINKEMTAIERYAVRFMETMVEDETAEELKITEEDIENSKKEWELARLKALKEEEEMQDELEEDDILYTYLLDLTQVFRSSLDNSEMPVWCPPTPPHDSNDIYFDVTKRFLYNSSLMLDSHLPPVHVRRDHHRYHQESITTRRQRQRREEALHVPRSLFDRTASCLVKQRRDFRITAHRFGVSSYLHSRHPHAAVVRQPPVAHVNSSPDDERDQARSDWLIHEDWLLFKVVDDLCRVSFSQQQQQHNAVTPNWDLVGDVVNRMSRTFRCVRQCKMRYDNVIVPREEGFILHDVSPHKLKKTKPIFPKMKTNHPVKTRQLFNQDNNLSVTSLYCMKFDEIKVAAGGRPTQLPPDVSSSPARNAKHLAVLQDHCINYDLPLHPVQVAVKRADRIAREKKANAVQNVAVTETAQRPGVGREAAGIAAAGHAVLHSVGGLAVTSPVVAHAVSAQHLHSLVPFTAPSALIAVTGNFSRGPRLDLSAITGSLSHVSGQTTSVYQNSASLTQKLTALATSSTTALRAVAPIVHPQLAKGLTQHINLLRPIMRPQSQGSSTSFSVSPAHHYRAPMLNLTKQQGRTLVRTVGTPITEDQLKNALRVRHLSKAQSVQQATQIVQQGQVTGVGNQLVSATQSCVTLVKSIVATSSTVSSVAIPICLNVTVGQVQKINQPSRGATVGQLQQQQRMLLQQRRGVSLQSPRVTALAGVRGAHIPLIIPQKGSNLTDQLLQQFVKQQAGLQGTSAQHAIISVTPAVAACADPQILNPVVTKMSLTTQPLLTAPILSLISTVSTTVTITTEVSGIKAITGTSACYLKQNIGNVTTISMAAIIPQGAPIKTATAFLSTFDKLSGPKSTHIHDNLIQQSLQLASTTTFTQLTPISSAGDTVVVSTTVVRPITPAVHLQVVSPVTSCPPMLSADLELSGCASDSMTTQVSVQHQTQKATLHTMRTRNQPKHH